MSLCTVLVAADFRGRSTTFVELVTSCPGPVLVALTPAGDDIRRAVHELRFAGKDVHAVERSTDTDDGETFAELARIAAMYLGADTVTPVRVPEDVRPVKPVSAREPIAIVLRTTTFPGPAHKEFIVASVLPRVARSIYVPLHVPAHTAAVRVTLEQLGPAIVTVYRARAFRPGDGIARALSEAEIARMLVVCGHAAVGRRPLRMIAPGGAAEFDIDIPALWERGRCLGIELCVEIDPIATPLLSTACLDRVSEPFRDARTNA